MYHRTVQYANADMAFAVFTLPRLVVDKYNNYEVVKDYEWFGSRAQQMEAARLGFEIRKENQE